MNSPARRIIKVGRWNFHPKRCGSSESMPLKTLAEYERLAEIAQMGCRLGKRALKFRDFGKMAAIFCDPRDERAVRLVARESSKQRAEELYPEIADLNQQQMRAYRE